MTQMTHFLGIPIEGWIIGVISLLLLIVRLLRRETSSSESNHGASANASSSQNTGDAQEAAAAESGKSDSKPSPNRFEKITEKLDGKILSWALLILVGSVGLGIFIWLIVEFAVPSILSITSSTGESLTKALAVILIICGILLFKKSWGGGLVVVVFGLLLAYGGDIVVTNAMRAAAEDINSTANGKGSVLRVATFNGSSDDGLPVGVWSEPVEIGIDCSLKFAEGVGETYKAQYSFYSDTWIEYKKYSLPKGNRIKVMMLKAGEKKLPYQITCQ